MFKKYFEELQHELLSSTAGAKKTASRKTGGEKPAKAGSAKKTSVTKQAEAGVHNVLKEVLDRLVRPDLQIGSAPIIDSSGYTPEGVDLVVYKPLFRNLDSIMGGFIPFEAVYGALHVCPHVDNKALADVLSRVIQAKKINRFSETRENNPVIPSFVVSYGTGMSLADVKNYIIDFYISKSVEHAFEFDLFAILGKGLVIKNWREKRNFVAIESGKDTLMWFFILLNEYLDTRRGDSIELRDYVHSPQPYKEY